MKRLFTLILGVALIASMHSCKTIEEDNGQIVEKKLKITAVIDDKLETRVSYDIDNNANVITPSWQVDDEVFGFDVNNNTFTFKVTSIGENGATLEPVGSYTATEGTTVYAIFAPGYTVDNLGSNTLAVDLAEQGGVLDPSTPALMCATGSVNADNELNLHFANQTAIIGVKKFQLNGATAAGTVTSMTINGVVTEGTFQVNDGVLELVPGTGTGSITATHPGGGWTTEDNGICEAGVYFAAMPTSETPEITLNAVAGGIKYVNVSSIAATAMEPGKYYYMSKKLESAAVAIINDTTPYYTIDEAWTAANTASEPCTIKLLKDCSPAAQLLLNNTGTGAVTLDLNGKVLTTAYQIRVNNARELTVTDNSSSVLDEQGAIMSTNASEKAVYIDASTFNLQGGTISSSATNVGESYPYALYSINATTLNLSGGKIVGNNFNALFVGTVATATVSGTKVNSKVQHGIYASGSLTITEGEVVAEGGYAAIYVTNTGSLTVSGGTFDSNAAPVITKAGSSNSAQVTGGLFSRQTEGDLFTVSSSGKCYVTGGYFDRPINSDRAKTSGGNDRPNKLNDNAATKDAYPYTVVSGTNYCNVTVDGNSSVYHHNAFASATKQANTAKANATIKAATNASNLGINDYTNIHGHTITLDINGKSLPTTNSAVITSAGKLIITDSGSPKGSISSNKTQVVYMVQAGADVTIDGCVITTSATTSTNAWDYAPINLNSASSKITIRNGAVISTAGSVTAISNRAGTLIIDDAVVTSGKTSTGLVAVYNGDSDATTTINGGSFYTSSTNNLRPTVYNGITAAGTAGSVTINGGYFYSTLDRDVRCAWSADNARLTINGGYFAHSTNWTVNPTYGPGKSLQLLDPPVPHMHAGVEYNYNYQVTDTPTQP